jgi:TPR repeat protein
MITPFWSILLFILVSILLSKLSSYLKYRRELPGKELLKVDFENVFQKANKILNDPDAPHSSHLFAIEMLKEIDNVEAKRQLADTYFLGTYKIKNDFNHALKLYQELADAGDSHGLYMLGIYYAEGIVHEKDFPKVKIKTNLV